MSSRGVDVYDFQSYRQDYCDLIDVIAQNIADDICEDEGQRFRFFRDNSIIDDVFDSAKKTLKLHFIDENDMSNAKFFGHFAYWVSFLRPYVLMHEYEALVWCKGFSKYIDECNVEIPNTIEKHSTPKSNHSTALANATIAVAFYAFNFVRDLEESDQVKKKLYDAIFSSDRFVEATHALSSLGMGARATCSYLKQFAEISLQNTVEETL